MSLQAKFALMLGLIGLVVVLALAGGLVSLNFMHEEVRRPFESMSGALLRLERVKLSIERERHILTREHDEEEPGASRDAQRSALASRLDDAAELRPRRATEADKAEFAQARAAIAAAMDELARDDWARMVTGGSTLANLRARLSAASDLAGAWMDGGDHGARVSAADALLDVFDLVRRTESRVVRETHELLAHTTDVRARLRNVAIFIMLVTALTCALGVLLVRRWVLRPVAELRTAAARIAAGDFAHRVPVRGSDELAGLSAEVNTMAGMVKTLQIEAVDRERLAAVGEMVERIAHNLRSPLAGIRGLAEMTRTELDAAKVEPAVRDDLGENQSRIIDAVDRFEQWLRDLLDATRPMRLQPAAADPRAWLEHLAKAYLPAAQARGASLRLVQDGAPSLAVFDAAQLELALGALIANALDAAGARPNPDRPPLVTVTSRVAGEAGQDGQSWQIEVRDNGPGVPAELHEKIFAPYFTTKREGTGIGLALARQIVRAHGGELSLADPPSMGRSHEDRPSGAQGAVFVIRLPLGRTDEMSGGVATAGHSEATSGQNSGH